MVDFVLLAGGKGKRLEPITENKPKCMVRILQKPLLGQIVNGIYPMADKIIIVVRYKKEQIMNYFSNSKFKDKIIFAEQKEHLGTGNALLAAEQFAGEKFVVMNGDTFFDKELFKIIEENLEYLFIIGKKVEDARPYGAIKSKGGYLEGIEEKPKEKKSGLVNTGTFMLTNEIFEYLKKEKKSERGEIELTSAVEKFAKKSKIKVVEFGGFWEDVGYYWKYLDANKYALGEMHEKNEGRIEKFVSINGKVNIGQNTIIKSGTVIEGPVYIGKNCKIGPNAYIRPFSTIEDECRIGNGVEIKNSIIMRGTKIAHLSYVGDSVLCEDVNLGGGTKLANLRFDEKNIEVEVSNRKVNSRRRKLGSVIGAGTKTGVNVSINCGIRIGTDVKIYPHSFVRKNIENNKIFK